MKGFFDGRGHYPSPEMWSALGAVAETMEQMAEGRAEPVIHLSSLDPGVGKTTAVICFLQALLASPAHDEVGAVVCVRRKDQIEAVVKEAGLAMEDFGVLTADRELNALGCGSPREARVLFTTHAMIEKRCDGRRFADVGAFHYQGRPRAVRIWDEAILPGQTLTLRRDDRGLFAPLRGHHPALTDAIETLFSDLKRADDGAAIRLPDLAEDYGVELNQALSLVSDRPELASAVEALWFLFGRHATVRRDGAYGQTMLDYRDTLPDDLACPFSPSTPRRGSAPSTTAGSKVAAASSCCRRR
jgi:hypothetical protein